MAGHWISQGLLRVYRDKVPDSLRHQGSLTDHWHCYYWHVNQKCPMDLGSNIVRQPPTEWGEVLGLLQEAVRHGVRDRDGSRSELLLPLIIMRFIFLDYLILEYEQKCSTSYEEQCHGYGYHQSCTKVQSVWRKKNLMWIMTWWFCKNNYKVWWLVVNLYLCRCRRRRASKFLRR